MLWKHPNKCVANIFFVGTNQQKDKLPWAPQTYIFRGFYGK